MLNLRSVCVVAIASSGLMLSACQQIAPGLVESTEFGGTSDSPNEIDYSTGLIEADYHPPAITKAEANAQFTEAVSTVLDELKYTVESWEGDTLVAVSPEGQRVQMTADEDRTYSSPNGTLKAVIFRPGAEVTYGDIPDTYWESVRDLNAAIGFHLNPSKWSRERYRNRVSLLNNRLNAARATSVGAVHHHHHATPRMPATPKMPY
ncbi:MAG: hypothetical protein AAGI30_09860 [Planctomycetota bacterium]